MIADEPIYLITSKITTTRYPILNQGPRPLAAKPISTYRLHP